jgi:hypothetical protein
MLTMLNLKDVLRALCTAILMCGLVSPITIFANDSDGTRFYPNSFDVELTSAGMADLSVYSRGNEYTDLDLYYDYSVGATIRASLGRNTRSRLLGVKVRLSGAYDTGSYQLSTGTRLPAFVSSVAREANMQTLSVFNHRNVAAFAINACQKNIVTYLRLNPSTTEDRLFAQDFTLPFKMDYNLKLHGGPSWDTTRESNERYQQLVRTGRNIICHKNSDGHQYRPPSDTFIIRKINLDIVPEVLRAGQCRLKTKVQFRTNRPDQEISYTIKHVHNNQYTPGTNPYALMQSESLGPYALETDRNGVASGEIEIAVDDRPDGNHKSKVGNVRVIGESDEFESKLLSYEMDCQKPGAGSNMIKTLGTTPTQQIPSSALPKSAPIARPDAPDTRLQQNSNRPALKLQKPTFGIKQPIFNNRPVLKPVVPNSRVALPKKADAIKSTTPASSLKPMQPAASVPVLKPVLEKKRVPVLKLDLKD